VYATVSLRFLWTSVYWYVGWNPSGATMTRILKILYGDMDTFGCKKVVFNYSLCTDIFNVISITYLNYKSCSSQYRYYCVNREISSNSIFIY